MEDITIRIKQISLNETQLRSHLSEANTVLNNGDFEKTKEEKITKLSFQWYFIPEQRDAKYSPDNKKRKIIKNSSSVDMQQVLRELLLLCGLSINGPLRMIPLNDMNQDMSQNLISPLFETIDNVLKIGDFEETKENMSTDDTILLYCFKD